VSRHVLTCKDAFAICQCVRSSRNDRKGQRVLMDSGVESRHAGTLNAGLFPGQPKVPL
jgi:hypothetical protein